MKKVTLLNKTCHYFCHLSFNLECLHTGQNTQHLTSSFRIFRNIFESWSSNGSLCCLVKGCFVNTPSFWQYLLQEKVYGEVENWEVGFPKTVVLHGRKYLPPRIYSVHLSLGWSLVDGDQAVIKYPMYKTAPSNKE